MPETRRATGMAAKEEHQDGVRDVIFISGGEKEEQEAPTVMEIQRKRLRQRWELASILNFFKVFEPVIRSNLKLSAEEIETALIEPNDSLAQLHIALLKGLAKSSKVLNVTDAWVSVLSKKLAMWWPWVAEGGFPLTAAKGEEMNEYKELDPTIRLFLLKALCEIRADRDDIVSYINKTVNNGAGLCIFQKEKLGEDGSGTLYWYDGNDEIGHRLYKEVQMFELLPKVKGRVKKLGIISQWETLATNFEEFREVVSEFSSSEVQLEVAVAKAVEANIIPALERIQKKKEKVLKQQRKQEMLINGLRNSAITRTGRTRRPVSYRYDEYDKAIEEAIEVSQHRKTPKELRLEAEHKESSNPAHLSGFESTEDDNNDENHQGVCGDQKENDENQDDNHDSNNDVQNFNEENDKVNHKVELNSVLRNLNGWTFHRPEASHRRKRLAGTVNINVPEVVRVATKHTLRQCPTVNTPVESAIVPDSEDENQSKQVNKRVRICSNSSEAVRIHKDNFSS